MSKLIQAPHITNLRDLGGYICADGKYLKKGCFYRSAGLSFITKEDEVLLEELGVKIILDLRSLPEAECEPDLIPEFCEYYRHSGIVTMDQEEREKSMDVKKFVMEIAKKASSLGDPREYLMECYQTMARHSDAFREMFALIRNNPEKPLLFHCSAGKDRTGVAAALILLALGATEETVFQDYLLSNEFRKKENEGLLAIARQHITDEQLLITMQSMLSVHEEWLRMYMDTVHEQYGSWELYFEKALALTKEQRRLLRERYLSDKKVLLFYMAILRDSRTY